MKEYILKPTMTLKTVTPTPTPDKSAVARLLPARPPLPTATIDPAKPMLKLGLDGRAGATNAFGFAFVVTGRAQCRRGRMMKTV